MATKSVAGVLHNSARSVQLESAVIGVIEAMSRPQFSIRSLLWLTLVVALACTVGPPASKYLRSPVPAILGGVTPRITVQQEAELVDMSPGSQPLS